MPPRDSIHITNATLHNLKHLSLDIPRRQIIAITGVSGSGKSTLAFDLVYEQGRRRYLQSIGMLTDLAEETGCERITGLGPTIAVQQGIIRQSNPRSSVGTRSGIFTYLRMLYVYAGQRACPSCGARRGISQPCPSCGDPAMGLIAGNFSYNSPLGMCLRCEGRGYLFELDLEKLLPTPQTTLRQALDNAGSPNSFQYLLRGLFKEYADRPFMDAPAPVQQHMLYGKPLGNGRTSHNLFDHLRYRMMRGREVNGCIRRGACPECAGDRVSAEARQATVLGQHIGQVGRMAALELEDFARRAAGLPDLPPAVQALVEEIARRARSLSQNGLGHLSLYRELPSLSGGELQRLFLASHIDAQLDSLIYVLDEPSVGLHELEKQRLLEQLRLLRDQGNTVLLVEHDPHLIAAADTIIDIGPLAGSAGGELVYQGDYPGLLDAAGASSVTGQYLSGRAALPSRKATPPAPAAPSLRLLGVSTNNLRGVNVTIPLGCMVGVAGVSGSGKSSLVMKTLVPLLERHFEKGNGASGCEEDSRRAAIPERHLPASQENPRLHERRAGIPALQEEWRVGPPRGEVPALPQGLEGAEADPAGDGDPAVIFTGRLEGAQLLSGFSAVSQLPIGRHDNSNPASYLKIWDAIRKQFAATPEARALGLGPGDFSFNAGGACRTCSGSGKQRLWLGGSFFATHLCPECQGRRFHDAVLKVRLRGKTILDVIEMPAAEACAFFSGEAGITRVLEVLVRSGMGYLQLGQPAPTLSGGEAQRIKLALEISRRSRSRRLYILDEPTIGLSLYDTAHLLRLVDELVQKGNSVLVIEHDPVVLSRCDWIIELGPGGGKDGGRVIAAGTPAALRADPRSRVGPFLGAP